MPEEVPWSVELYPHRLVNAGTSHTLPYELSIILAARRKPTENARVVVASPLLWFTVLYTLSDANGFISVSFHKRSERAFYEGKV